MRVLLNNKPGGHRLAATLVALCLALSITARAPSLDDALDLLGNLAVVADFGQSHRALATHAIRQTWVLEKGAQRAVHANAAISEQCASGIELHTSHFLHLDWIRQPQPGVYSIAGGRSPPGSTSLA